MNDCKSSSKPERTNVHVSRNGDDILELSPPCSTPRCSTPSEGTPGGVNRLEGNERGNGEKVSRRSVYAQKRDGSSDAIMIEESIDRHHHDIANMSNRRDNESSREMKHMTIQSYFLTSQMMRPYMAFPIQSTT